MNIIKLMTILRKIFTQFEVPEMPAFPASLAENWCHPDFYLSMKGNKLGPCFTFQSFFKPDGFLSADTTKTPDLIWLVSTQVGPNVYINSIRRFFEILSGQILQDETDNIFAVIPDLRRKLNPGEAGVFWKIIFAGVECGRISLYSCLPGAKFNSNGSVIVTLQLNKIVSILTSTDFSVPAPWVGNLSASTSMAMHAWQQLEEDSGFMSSRILEALNYKTDNEKLLIKSFCKVFRVYNNYSRHINQEPELYNSFANAIKLLSDKILLAQDSDEIKKEKATLNVA